MRLEGRLRRDGDFWLVEIPVLDAMTQGRNRDEALEMAADWVESMLNDSTIEVKVHPVAEKRFEIEVSDPGPLVALLLRRQRQKNGLTLTEVARRLGQRSPNTYARYERGETTPSIAMLDRLLKAVSDRELVVSV